MASMARVAAPTFWMPKLPLAAGNTRTELSAPTSCHLSFKGGLYGCTPSSVALVPDCGLSAGPGHGVLGHRHAGAGLPAAARETGRPLPARRRDRCDRACAGAAV